MFWEGKNLEIYCAGQQNQGFRRFAKTSKNDAKKDIKNGQKSIKNGALGVQKVIFGVPGAILGDCKKH